MARDSTGLPLFEGEHVPRVRFARALERLDLRAALADAPGEWRSALQDLVAATDERADLGALVACRRPGWPAEVERAWQRLVGRNLDGHGIPGVLDGELAAAFLLRGGERSRAHRSVVRHLGHHPADVRGWTVLTGFEPVRAAVRCAFHGGRTLDDTVPELVALADLVCDDELEPVSQWLLAYAYLERMLPLDEIADALRAEGVLEAPPMLLPGDARAFAWYLLDAGGRPLGRDSAGVVAARRRLQRISPAAFRRYLRRVATSGNAPG